MVDTHNSFIQEYLNIQSSIQRKGIFNTKLQLYINDQVCSNKVSTLEHIHIHTYTSLTSSYTILLIHILIYSILMTKFGKCTKPFPSRKVVSKIIYIRIAISTIQLAKHVKKSKLEGVRKFDLIVQSSWLNCIQ